MDEPLKPLACICCQGPDVRVGGEWAHCANCKCEWQPAMVTPEPRATINEAKVADADYLRSRFCSWLQMGYSAHRAFDRTINPDTLAAPVPPAVVVPAERHALELLRLFGRHDQGTASWSLAALHLYEHAKRLNNPEPTNG